MRFARRALRRLARALALAPQSAQAIPPAAAIDRIAFDRRAARAISRTRPGR